MPEGIHDQGLFTGVGQEPHPALSPAYRGEREGAFRRRQCSRPIREGAGRPGGVEDARTSARHAGIRRLRLMEYSGLRPDRVGTTGPRPGYHCQIPEGPLPLASSTVALAGAVSAWGAGSAAEFGRHRTSPEAELGRHVDQRTEFHGSFLWFEPEVSD